MNGKYCNQGQALILQWMVGQETPPGLQLKLYKNDVTPADDDTEANYIEADFSGYESVSYDGVDFDAPVIGNPTSITGSDALFTANAGQQQQIIYGQYFVTDDERALLICAERFDTPIKINNNGDSIAIAPTLTAKSPNP